MKIRIGDVSVATPVGSPAPGEVVDFDDEIAKSLIAAGLASAVKGSRKTAERATARKPSTVETADD